MTVVDANVLLYAVDEDSLHHERANGWLTRALGGSETLVLPWVSLLAFLRLVTNPRIYPAPLTLEQASEIVATWLARPNVVAGNPGPDHWRHLSRLLEHTGTGGNLVADAHVAAIALELGATVTTYDNDFDRFGVAWQLPPA